MAPNSKIQAITFLASIFDLRGCVDLVELVEGGLGH
eukprot:COSAG01_NODE_565_length_15436_cov_64.116581_11_plen_36_part_00